MKREDITAKLIGYKDNRKSIFIQIDGLAFDILNRAIDEGYLNNIKKLINSKRYLKYKVFSELPSNTPAAQMKIMYGIKGKIPAFRWYNKEKKQHYTFKLPQSADILEKVAVRELEKTKGKPLLEEGASYINLYSGGAKRIILTSSKMLDINIKRRLKSNEVWLFMVLNIDFLFTIVIKVIKEFIVELYEYFKYKILNKPQRDEKFFPYVRILTAVFFREVATYGAMLEMNEGVERIYITYNGYDELGHQRGPETKEALKTLKGIDSNINKIIKKSFIKNYNVYIFSDHGQTTSIPFEKKYGISIKEWIVKNVEGSSSVGNYNTGKENREVLFSYFFLKLQRGLKILGGLFFKIAAQAVKWILKKFGNNYIKNQDDGDGDEEIIVTNSGPLSHIYLNKYKERVTEEKISEVYGLLFYKIVSHEGIEFGIVKQGNGYKILGKNGQMILDCDFKQVSKDGNVFANIEGTEEMIIDAIGEIVLCEEAGDIILFGALIKDNKLSPAGTVVINFEIQYGGHGGIGGMQCEPFLITKEILNENLSITDLYHVFSGDDLNDYS